MEARMGLLRDKEEQYQLQKGGMLTTRLDEIVFRGAWYNKIKQK